MCRGPEVERRTPLLTQGATREGKCKGPSWLKRQEQGGSGPEEAGRVREVGAKARKDLYLELRKHLIRDTAKV